MRFLHRLYHPEVFQGNLRKKNYFEGWYYKLVDAEENNAIALIPGISIGRDEPDHAFIQVLDGKMNSSHYYRFDVKDFSGDQRKLDVRIAGNQFTGSNLSLNGDGIKGDVSWKEITPIPSSILNPGIMGWYSFVPGMECYHGIVSMHHRLSGQLVFGDREIDFNGGTGYIEKDWGTSFPRCWIWAHSNNFDHKLPVSLMASVAHIPWMGSYFVGFIVAILVYGEIRIFATYNGSSKKISIEGGTVHMQFKNRREILEITAHTAPGAALYSPIKGIMTGKVNESLQSEIKIAYHDGNKLIFSGSSSTSGLEVAGDTDILLSEGWSER